MPNAIGSQLAEYFDRKGITQVEIAKQLNVSKAYVNSLFTGRRPFGKKQAEIWEATYGISRSWLLTGEGEMLKQEDIHIVEPGVGDHKGMIPFYDAETTGGATGYVSSSMEDVNLVGYIKPGGWFGGKITAAIRHVGESMTEYPDGCILAVREVTERRLLVPGRNYVVETTEFRVTKRLQKGTTPDTVALYSTNQERYADGRLIHEPFEVAFEDIRRIYSVIGYIVNQAGDCQILQIR